MWSSSWATPIGRGQTGVNIVFVQGIMRVMSTLMMSLTVLIGHNLVPGRLDSQQLLGWDLGGGRLQEVPPPFPSRLARGGECDTDQRPGTGSRGPGSQVSIRLLIFIFFEMLVSF